MLGGLVDLVDHRLVEAGRHQVDHLHAGGELGMFLGRHLARDEDAEMADRLVQRVDDGLAVGDDLVLVAVEVGDPAQRLLRRRDVVAPRAQHDDRRLDVAQVDADAVGGADLARGELVADEEIVGDPLHLAGIEQHRAAPPGLEIEEAMGLGVDLGIDVVDLAPVGVGRIERFEVGHEVGAVEDAVAHVAGERGQPGAAQRAAEIAHRVAPAHARPVGERRARQQDRTDEIGPDRRHHHDLPAGLAVGDDDGLALGLGMARRDLGDERRFGRAHVFDGLSGHGLREEADEVAGMAGRHGDADLAVLLHPADAGSMAGARVDDDEGRLGRIDRFVVERDDAHQRIVHRPGQGTAVEDGLELEAQHVRRVLGTALEGDVAALTQRVKRQDRTLPRVQSNNPE